MPSSPSRRSGALRATATDVATPMLLATLLQHPASPGSPGAAAAAATNEAERRALTVDWGAARARTHHVDLRRRSPPLPIVARNAPGYLAVATVPDLSAGPRLLAAADAHELHLGCAAVNMRRGFRVFIRAADAADSAAALVGYGAAAVPCVARSGSGFWDGTALAVTHVVPTQVFCLDAAAAEDAASEDQPRRRRRPRGSSRGAAAPRRRSRASTAAAQERDSAYGPPALDEEDLAALAARGAARAPRGAGALRAFILEHTAAPLAGGAAQRQRRGGGGRGRAAAADEGWGGEAPQPWGDDGSPRDDDEAPTRRSLSPQLARLALK